MIELRLFILALAVVALVAFLSSPPHTAKLVLGVSPPQPYPLQALGFNETITALREHGHKVVMVPTASIPDYAAKSGRLVVLALEPLQCPERSIGSLAEAVWRAAARAGRVAVVVADDTPCGMSIVEAVARGAFRLEVISMQPGLGAARLYTPARGYMVVDRFMATAFKPYNATPRLAAVAASTLERRVYPLGYTATLRHGNATVVLAYLGDGDAFRDSVVELSHRLGLANEQTLTNIVRELAHGGNATIIVPADFYLGPSTARVVVVAVDPQSMLSEAATALERLEARGLRLLSGIPGGLAALVAVAALATYTALVRAAGGGAGAGPEVRPAPPRRLGRVLLGNAAVQAVEEAYNTVNTAARAALGVELEELLAAAKASTPGEHTRALEELARLKHRVKRLPLIAADKLEKLKHQALEAIDMLSERGVEANQKESD